MAKTNTVLIKLVSSADTGFFYVTKKNPRDQDRQARAEEIRPGRAQARRLQGSEDQVAQRAAAQRPARSGGGRERRSPAASASSGDDPVAAAVLGVVERFVGALQQRVDGVAAAGVTATPMLIVIGRRSPARLARRSARRRPPLRSRSATTMAACEVGLRHHDDEFLAAVARDEIEAAHVRAARGRPPRAAPRRRPDDRTCR